MKVVSEFRPRHTVHHAVNLAIGVFDGIHRGHQRVLKQTIAEARTVGGQSWVLTFNGHPRRLLSPHTAPPLLTSLPHKLNLLNEFKIDGCLVVPFTRQLAALTPARFVKLLTGTFPRLNRILVGSNWRFGRGGSGTPDTLAQFGAQHGFSVSVIAPAQLYGAVISSTRIRAAVTSGHLAEARNMLGRPFSVMGTVVTGRGIGRKLGFPTANLKIGNEVLPPSGVYAVWVRMGRKVRTGVANIGTHPTFHAASSLKKTPTLEVHIFDFKTRLRGHSLEVFFVRKLRNEHCFASLQALIRQMQRDSTRARRILAGKNFELTRPA
ncbi:MAG: riboflavin biosynthesis protein RibF [Lentisphaerae bacterium RIFOXYB12_FULL_60_10]|nr:MAG: riboflavin biosynthesis protein RibF [Lentisphaerae bacterium RIFOXYB12_FULL_60_10]